MKYISSKQSSYGYLIIPGIVMGALLISIAFLVPNNLVTPVASSTSTPTPSIAVTLPTSTNSVSIPTAEPPLVLFPCSPQYPPNLPLDWISDYTATDAIALEDIYTQKYGKKQSKLDLYAVAYYNNRKSLEETSYYFIDPIKLSVENGGKIFLPPPIWIDTYVAFPIPILKTIIQNNIDSTINISGSSVLYPLSLQMSKCFREATKAGQIRVRSNSTLLGLFDYCQGDVDLISASEEITQEMMDRSRCTGVNFLKFEVARYAITIFINEESPYSNDVRDNPLTRAELRRLLISANSWNDIRNSWDDKPIKRYYTSSQGGTYEIVKKELFPDLVTNPANSTFFEIGEDYLIPSNVVNDKYSVGFSGDSYYQIYKDQLRVIPIDDISPNPDTINGDNPSYPLTRSLYLYTGATNYEKNALLQYFINYYLAYEFDFIDELGYFYPSKDGFLNNPNMFPY